MSEMRCPGQDSRFIRPQDICELQCPQCRRVVEFWPDELLRKCPGCGRRLSNPNFNMGCLEWCRWAPKCMEHMRESRQEAVRAVRDELAEAVRGIFDGDAARIEHAMSVAELAEQIGRAENADPFVIVPAALLHDLGLAGTPLDADSPAVQAHGTKGAEEALRILQSLDFPDSVAREVAEIIAHHHEREAMTGVNGRTIWDADLIVNLRKLPREDALERLRRQALTEGGLRVGKTRLSE